MIKKRINTDLFLTIPILENNVEVNLSDVNNLHVYLYNNCNSIDYSYKISNNNILLQYSKKDNTSLGVYGVTIKYSKTNTNSEVGSIDYAVDFPCLFQIVRYSTEEENVDTALSSNLTNSIK